MSGITVTIQQLTDHDYTNLAQGQSNTLSPALLGEMDTSQFREGTLEVLVTGATIPTGASIAIRVFAIGRTPDAPGSFFSDQTNFVATVTISASITGPTLVRASFASNFGSMIGVGVIAAVGSGTGGFSATFQTNVSLKS